MKFLIETDLQGRIENCNALGETELVCIENSSKYPIRPNSFIQKLLFFCRFRSRFAFLGCGLINSVNTMYVMLS